MHVCHMTVSNLLCLGSWLSLVGVKGWPITLYGLCYWQSTPILTSVMLKGLEMTSLTIVVLHCGLQGSH